MVELILKYEADAALTDNAQMGAAAYVLTQTTFTSTTNYPRIEGVAFELLELLLHKKAPAQESEDKSGAGWLAHIILEGKKDLLKAWLVAGGDPAHVFTGGPTYKYTLGPYLLEDEGKEDAFVRTEYTLERSNALLLACAMADLTLVGKLLTVSELGVDQKDKEGHSPLGVVCSYDVRLNPDGECRNCSAAADTANKACGHTCLCQSCANILSASSQNPKDFGACPICDTPVKKNGWTTTIRARHADGRKYRCQEIALLLLQHGADPKVTVPNTSAVLKGVRSPLGKSRITLSPNYIAFPGSKPQDVAGYLTPLVAYISKSNYTMVEALCKAGANTEEVFGATVRKAGFTWRDYVLRLFDTIWSKLGLADQRMILRPIHLAVMQDDRRLVNCLCHHGAPLSPSMLFSPAPADHPLSPPIFFNLR
jgi:hypothetical protein